MKLIWDLSSVQGKTRLSKWYTPYEDAEKRKLSNEIHKIVNSRESKFTNFVEFRTHKIVYRRYAGLFFLYAILDEVFLAGELMEPSKQVVLQRMEFLDNLP
ncbi:adaptor-related protein complex 2 [Cavenderia fasciculata]|uniref:AP complex subunit sigma n=1 Tax=Cavenderia fasciculata TaxID=261658 RepID=F4PYJ4_CACFS|nr:adaptor-related protein complex 2 [Cavenderia fasciculata]EGG19260.1 adaptor-related protein complex 2 [Cavenderia fasciculata]|eukprot:XP_004357531.1 adaptor-related protein complex 2 [Cavenderia fasciculata]